LDNDQFLSLHKKVAKFLVDFNVAGGLPKEVTLSWGEEMIVQKLNYLGFCLGLTFAYR